MFETPKKGCGLEPEKHFWTNVFEKIPLNPPLGKGEAYGPPLLQRGVRGDCLH